MFQLMPLPLTVSCFRLVLPFWYRLTWVVLEKGPLNGCVCVCVGHTNKMSETPVMSDSLCVRQACMSCGRLADTEVIRRAFLSTSLREFLHWCHRGRASTESRGSVPALCLSAVLSLNKAVVDYRLRPPCVATWELLYAHAIFSSLYTQGRYVKPDVINIQ